VDRSVLPLVVGAARRKSVFQRRSSRALMVVRIRREFVLWRNHSLCCRLRVGFVRSLILEDLYSLNEVVVAVAGGVIMGRRKLMGGVVDRSVLPLVAGPARRRYIFQQGSSRTPIVVQVIREFGLWRKRSLGCRLRVGFLRRLLEDL
jgi:hypothetical protein